MTNTVVVVESVGYGPDSERAVEQINLLATDQHSDVQSRLQFPGNGLFVYSCERWVRLQVASTLGAIRNVAFWVNNYSPNLGWQLRYGVSSTWRRPSSAPSSIAYDLVPTSEPTTANLAAGDVTDYTPWVVLQAVWTDPAYTEFEEDILDFRFAWSDV